MGFLNNKAKDGFEASAELIVLAGKEFGRSSQSSRFKYAGVKAKSQMMSAHSIPQKISSRPNFLMSFLNVASGHGFYDAERLELVERLQDQIKQSIERGSLIPFVQSERPFGDMSNYRKLMGILQDFLLRFMEMRKAIVDLDSSTDTEIGRFRVDISTATKSVLKRIANVLRALALAPSDRSNLTRLREELAAEMEICRTFVEDARKRHFGYFLFFLARVFVVVKSRMFSAQ